MNGKPWLLTLNDPTPNAANGPPTSVSNGSANRLPADTLGLALSGGGIRSAAFCLGVLQSLARAGWLRWVDYLSTVSGGGYIGAFLGRYFDLCSRPDGLGGPIPNTTPGFGQECVARGLSDSQSDVLSWLRRHANYLSPTGVGGIATGLAAYWRNLIAIYLVVGSLLFAAFGILNALEYWPGGGIGYIVHKYASLTPLTDTFIDRPTAWAVLCELLLWLAGVPLALAFWTISQDESERFRPPVLLAAAVVAAVVLVATGSPLGVVVVLAAVIWAVRVWAVIRRTEGHFDLKNPARMALARVHLTNRLATALTVTAGLGAFAIIDATGRELAGWMVRGGMTGPNVGAWLVSMGGMVVALASALRMLAGLFTGPPRRSGVWALARPHLWAALLVLLGAVPPLIGLAFLAHAAYGAGESFAFGVAATVVALIVSLLLGLRSCVQFVNRSGPMSIYASRLARAFFGAVNPARRTHPEGQNVSYLVPGDDVPLADYAPQDAGGPLHLINCAVNETIDVASQRGLRDRQAENFAIGPAGVSVAQEWHALWEKSPEQQPGTSAQDQREKRRLRPLAEHQEAAPHPFLPRKGNSVAAEELSLRDWIAVSGGALSPSSGRQTSLARALLFTLANLRLGYWWDSGLNFADRASVPPRKDLGAKFLRKFSVMFQSQALLLAELTARFAGPWERYWALSDGGNFEVTGVYELLRRRVPFIILCDAGEDPERTGADFARLVRIARVDLGAEFTDADLTMTPPGVQPFLAPSAQLLTQPAKAHAALLKVTYPTPAAGTDPWDGRCHSWLLYLKTTLTGDEPADVANYATEHPDFPNESTLNQFFDEPQWESYRELGDHTGSQVFL